MEYILQLEQKQRHLILAALVGFSLFFVILSFVKLGFQGLILCAGLLFITILTPLLLTRPKLFLFLWLLLLPFGEFIYVLKVNIAGMNPISLAIFVLSIPFALVLFYKEIGNCIKSLPFLFFIIVFQLIIFFHLFRNDVSFFNVMQQIKSLFSLIFIICLTHIFLIKNKPDIIFKWINIVVITNSIMAILQKITGIGVVFMGGVPRVQGITGHPNSCGFLINIYLTFALYMFFNAKTKKSRVLWGINLLINIVALILTISKTSFFIFALFILITFLHLPLKYKLRSLIYTSIGCIIFILSDYILNMNIINSVLVRFSDVSTYSWRVHIWNLLLNNMDFHSYLFGHGIASSSRYIMQVSPSDYPQAHNCYIQIIYEYGIIGLIYIGSFLFVLIKSAVNYFSAKDIAYKITCMVPFFISMIFLIEMYTDGALFVKVASYYAWVLITIFYLKMNSDKQNLSDRKLVNN